MIHSLDRHVSSLAVRNCLNLAATGAVPCSTVEDLEENAVDLTSGSK
jgi:hypothetical protein